VGWVLKTTASRRAALLTTAILALGPLAACSNDNVDCGLNQCTVTIQRETNASVSVLGVDAKFISADQNTVTLEVAGEQIQLTKGQQAVEVAGLQVALNTVTQDDVSFQVSR
jgi:hypothetical protein